MSKLPLAASSSSSSMAPQVPFRGPTSDEKLGVFKEQFRALITAQLDDLFNVEFLKAFQDRLNKIDVLKQVLKASSIDEVEKLFKLNFELLNKRVNDIPLKVDAFRRASGKWCAISALAVALELEALFGNFSPAKNPDAANELMAALREDKNTLEGIKAERESVVARTPLGSTTLPKPDAITPSEQSQTPDTWAVKLLRWCDKHPKLSLLFKIISLGFFALLVLRAENIISKQQPQPRATAVVPQEKSADASIIKSVSGGLVQVSAEERTNLVSAVDKTPNQSKQPDSIAKVQPQHASLPLKPPTP